MCILRAMHTPEFRAKAIGAYVTEGNISRAAASLRMSRDTLRGWLKEPWAKRLLEELHEEHIRQMATEVRAVASLALDKVRDRLDADPKLSARDAAIIFGIMSEKAILWAEQAPREKEAVTPEDMELLNAMAEQVSLELMRRKARELAKGREAGTTTH